MGVVEDKLKIDAVKRHKLNNALTKLLGGCQMAYSEGMSSSEKTDGQEIINIGIKELHEILDIDLKNSLMEHE